MSECGVIVFFNFRSKITTGAIQDEDDKYGAIDAMLLLVLGGGIRRLGICTRVEWR